MFPRHFHIHGPPISQSQWPEMTASSAPLFRRCTITFSRASHPISMSLMPSPNNSACPTYLTPHRALPAPPRPPTTTSTPPSSPVPPSSVHTTIFAAPSNETSPTTPCPSSPLIAFTSPSWNGIFRRRLRRSTEISFAPLARLSLLIACTSCLPTGAPCSSCTPRKRVPPHSSPST